MFMQSNILFVSFALAKFWKILHTLYKLDVLGDRDIARDATKLSSNSLKQLALKGKIPWKVQLTSFGWQRKLNQGSFMVTFYLRQSR